MAGFVTDSNTIAPPALPLTGGGQSQSPFPKPDIVPLTPVAAEHIARTPGLDAGGRLATAAMYQPLPMTDGEPAKPDDVPMMGMQSPMPTAPGLGGFANGKYNPRRQAVAAGQLPIQQPPAPAPFVPTPATPQYAPEQWAQAILQVNARANAAYHARNEFEQSGQAAQAANDMKQLGPDLAPLYGATQGIQKYHQLKSEEQGANDALAKLQSAAHADGFDYDQQYAAISDERLKQEAASQGQGSEVGNVGRQLKQEATSGIAQKVQGMRGAISSKLADITGAAGFTETPEEAVARIQKGKSTWTEDFAAVNRDINTDITRRAGAMQDYRQKFPTRTLLGQQAVSQGANLMQLATALGGPAAFAASSGGDTYANNAASGADPSEAANRAMAAAAGTAVILKLSPLLGQSEAATVGNRVAQELAHGASVMYALNIADQAANKIGTAQKIDFLSPVLESILSAGVFTAGGAALRGMKGGGQKPIESADQNQAAHANFTQKTGVAPEISPEKPIETPDQMMPPRTPAGVDQNYPPGITKSPPENQPQPPVDQPAQPPQDQQAGAANEQGNGVEAGAHGGSVPPITLENLHNFIPADEGLETTFEGKRVRAVNGRWVEVSTPPEPPQTPAQPGAKAESSTDIPQPSAPVPPEQSGQPAESAAGEGAGVSNPSEVQRKPLYEMSHEELDHQHELASQYEGGELDRVFGNPEDAAKYRKLERAANYSSDTAKASRAYDELRDMEDKLSPDRQDMLFGRGKYQRPSTADIRDFRQALDALDDSSPQALGRSIARGMTDIGQGTDPAQMDLKQQKAYAQLRRASEIMNEKGWNQADVQTAAIRAAMSRFSDPNDAEFMLRRWLNPEHSPEAVKAVGVPDEVIKKLEAKNAAAQGPINEGRGQERAGNAESGAPQGSELGGGVQAGGEVSPEAQSEESQPPKTEGFDVDQSMLGGILQHSDTKAVYRAGDEKAADQASKGLVGTAAQSLKATSHYLIDEARRFKGSMFPTISRLGEKSGDLAAELVASKTFAKEAGKAAAMEIVGLHQPKIENLPKRGAPGPVTPAMGLDYKALLPKRIDPEIDKLAGAFLVQDNLDSIQRKFLDQADAATDPKEKSKFQELAANVGSMIGADGSPFDTRTDFAKAGMDPDVQKAIARYKEWFEGMPEENFRVSQGIAETEQLPTRGLQSGARVNLKAILPDDPRSASAIRTTMKGNLTNPRLKDSPFARMAKGSAPAYDISLSAMIENTLGKGTEIANQHRLFEQMVEDGIAKIGPAGQSVELGGKRAVPFEIEPARRFVVKKVGTNFEQTTAFTKPTQKLYVRVDAKEELRRALAVDDTNRIPVVTKAAEVANATALASLSEAAYHVSNQITALVSSPGTGMILPGMLKNLARLWAGGPEVAKQLASIAKIGALKEGPPSPSSTLGKLNPLRWTGSIIHATDRAGRLLMDDAFTKMADKGIVKDTPKNRRDFINQFGQYNGRAQQKLISLARETGLGPFATAGTNFLVMGVKKMALSPGATATTIPNAIRLRAMVLGRMAVPLAMVAAANYMKWGRMDGSANLPIGSLRLPDDKDGKMRYLDVLGNLGITRGLRATGALAGIEGLRRGESGSEIADKAVTDIGKSAISPFTGPIVRAGMTAFTGKDAVIGGYQTAKTAEKGGSQAAENFKAAAKGLNPLVDAITGGKNSQLGRFGIKTASKADQTQAEMLADRLAQDRLGGLNIPPSTKAKHDARQAVVQKLRSGEEIGKTLNQAVSDGVIANSDRAQIVKESRQSALANKIERAPVEDALAVWERANPRERADIKVLIMKKIAAARDMKPEEKRAAFAKMKVNASGTAGE